MHPNHKTVSCIIPAYNEGPRIARVLDIVNDHPLIHEVIVVDDGSHDDTKDRVKSLLNAKTRLITHEQNRGKTEALYTGITHSSGELLFFLDADLLGLSGGDVARLIEPVCHEDADIALSLRKNAPRLWHLIGIDYISGERVLHRSLLENHLDALRAIRGFGIEVFMNEIIIQNNCRIQVVPWEDVQSPYKYAKDGLFTGLMADLDMYRDMVSSVPPLELVKQIRAMRSARVQSPHA